MPDPVVKPDVTPDNPPVGAEPGTDKPIDWREQFLPPDLRAEKTLTKFKDVASFAKSYVEMEKYAGGAVRIPKDDAKPEEWNAFYAKIGRPDKPESYEIKLPDLPPGIHVDEPLVSRFRVEAHKLGLSNKQVQALVDLQARAVVEQHEAMQVGLREMGESTLRTEWGPLYERNIEVAQRAFRHLGDDESRDFLRASGLGNHPALVRLFYRVGKSLVEADFLQGDVSGATNAETAKAKIREIRANPKHPYHDRTSPDHKAAVDEVSRLYSLAEL